jgi:ligand-binding SRPBCC domain-containing protein
LKRDIFTAADGITSLSTRQPVCENGRLPVISLETWIKAPITRCFDLSRDIDLHMQSTAHTREAAIAGVTTGLIGPDEEVTWEATHFGVRQRLTSRITAYDRPSHFRDSQVRGSFRRFDHDHFFEQIAEATLMRDVFDYDSPLGLLGRVADRIFLKRYLTALLEGRNKLIKEAAERARMAQ